MKDRKKLEKDKVKTTEELSQCNERVERLEKKMLLYPRESQAWNEILIELNKKKLERDLIASRLVCIEQELGGLKRRYELRNQG